jgi:hypothetical protein
MPVEIVGTIDPLPAGAKTLDTLRMRSMTITP